MMHRRSSRSPTPHRWSSPSPAAGSWSIAALLAIGLIVVLITWPRCTRSWR